jgi:hypothetical protein
MNGDTARKRAHCSLPQCNPITLAAYFYSRGIDQNSHALLFYIWGWDTTYAANNQIIASQAYT